MNIIEFLEQLWGNTKSDKNKFGQYVETVGEERLKDVMTSFKETIAHKTIVQALRTVEEIARSRMVDIDPQDALGIARCQDYACMRTFYEYIVDGLSTVEIEKQFKDSVHMDSTPRPLL